MAIVGYDFWQNDLSRDPNVIGRTVRIKGIDFTIVGVTPQSFNAIDQFFTPSLFVPVMMSQRLDAAPGNPLEIRSDHFYSVKARLKPAVTWQKPTNRKITTASLPCRRNCKPG